MDPVADLVAGLKTQGSGFPFAPRWKSPLVMTSLWQGLGVDDGSDVVVVELDVDDVVVDDEEVLDVEVVDVVNVVGVGVMKQEHAEDTLDAG